MISTFEIHVGELRATFLRNHNMRRHKGTTKCPKQKTAQAEDNSSPQNAQATSRGLTPRRHDRKQPQRSQTRDGPTYAVPGPRIGAQIRQSTPNRMRLSARRPLVAAEFGARGIPVRRAPKLYGRPCPRASRGGVHQPTRGIRHIARPVTVAPSPSPRPWLAHAVPCPRPARARADPRGRPLPRQARTCGTMEA